MKSPFDLAHLDPLRAIREAKHWARHLPEPLRPSWLILATYYPQIFVGCDEMSILIGKSRATAGRYLRELEEIGAVRRVRQGRGLNRTDWRMLVLPEIGTCSGETPPWVEQPHRPRSTASAQMRNHLMRSRLDEITPTTHEISPRRDRIVMV